MNGHDPLCRAFYQMHMNANICRSCDLIRAVREDQNKVRPSGRLMYMSGYADGYTDGEAHGYEKALDYAIACFEQDDAYTAIQALRDL